MREQGRGALQALIWDHGTALYYYRVEHQGGVGRGEESRVWHFPACSQSSTDGRTGVVIVIVLNARVPSHEVYGDHTPPPLRSTRLAPLLRGLIASDRVGSRELVLEGDCGGGHGGGEGEEEPTRLLFSVHGH